MCNCQIQLFELLIIAADTLKFTGYSSFSDPKPNIFPLYVGKSSAILSKIKGSRFTLLILQFLTVLAGVKIECYVIDVIHQNHTTLKKIIKSVILVRQRHTGFGWNEAVKICLSAPGFGREVLVEERCETFECFYHKAFISKVQINKITINNSFRTQRFMNELKLYFQITLKHHHWMVIIQQRFESFTFKVFTHISHNC